MGSTRADRLVLSLVAKQNDNTEIDTSALESEALDAAAEAAVKAFAAVSDLESLASARSSISARRLPSPWPDVRWAVCPASSAPPPARPSTPRGTRVSEALETRIAELEAQRDALVLEAETIDVTLPSGRRRVGARHPITVIGEQIADVFVGMGWEIAEGPEVETEHYNFDALNFPARSPGTLHAGHLLRRAGGLAAGAAPTPRRCRSAPC